MGVTTERMSKLMTLLSLLSTASAVESEDGGFYGLARSVLRVAVTGRSPAPTVGDPCGLNITCIIQRVFDDHLPLSDADGDNHAGAGTDIFVESFRGTNWRGRDWYGADS